MENKIGDTLITYLRNGARGPFTYTATKFNYILETGQLSGVYQIQITSYYNQHNKDLKRMYLDVFWSNRWHEERFGYSKNVNVE